MELSAALRALGWSTNPSRTRSMATRRSAIESTADASCSRKYEPLTMEFDVDSSRKYAGGSTGSKSSNSWCGMLDYGDC